MFIINGRFLSQKPTGIHRYAFEMCDQLHKMGADFIVAMPKDVNEDYKLAFNTVKVGSLKGHLWEQLSLPKYLKSIGSPLLVSFSGCGPLNYKNQIMTIHDVSHERHPEWFSKNYWRYYGYMMPRIAKKSHAIITVSEYSKKEIVDVFKIAPEKLFVANCSIPSYHSEISIINTGYQELKTPEKYIISVSSFDPRKNFRRLIEAFNLMEDKTIKLYIVGMKFKAFNTPDLEGLLNENIILPGYVGDDELKILYKNAMFSIYPSLYEGFGIPPLESMINGCPVIGSKIEALEEICEDAILYTNPYDVKDMANKMNLLASNQQLRLDFKEKGSIQVKKYSWEKSARTVLDLVSKYV